MTVELELSGYCELICWRHDVVVCWCSLSSRCSSSENSLCSRCNDFDKELTRSVYTRNCQPVSQTKFDDTRTLKWDTLKSCVRIFQQEACSRIEAARCCVSVSSQLQQCNCNTSSAMFYYSLLRLQIYRCVQYVTNLFSSLLFGIFTDVWRGGLCRKQTCTVTVIHFAPTTVNCLSHASSHRSDSQIFIQNRDFCLPYLHLAPLLGIPQEYCHSVRQRKKLDCCGYPTVNFFEDMFIHFDRIHERDRRTDGRTPRDGIGCAYAQHRAAKIECVRTFYT